MTFSYNINGYNIDFYVYFKGKITLYVVNILKNTLKNGFKTCML